MGAAGTTPIYTATPDIQWIGVITAANNTLDISTGTSYLVFTAGANGSFVREIRIKANPANNTAATVARVWLNNAVNTTTAANSSFFTEIGIPATTASATTALPDFCIPMNIALQAGYKVYLTIGTAAGGSGEFQATCIAGDY